MFFIQFTVIASITFLLFAIGMELGARLGAAIAARRVEID